MRARPTAPGSGREGGATRASFYRLTIEYDGTRYSGWQVQPQHRTVQGALLEALRGAAPEAQLDLQGAGRTDAGVHALAQVASLRSSSPLSVRRLLAALERDLPADIAVLDLRPAPPGFHARHDAVARAYRYQIACRRSAFGKRFSWWVDEPLELDAMRVAAQRFVGRHDFCALSRRGVEGQSTVVVVESCEVEVGEAMVMIRLVASHFLWGQVRRMVGALVDVGAGRATPEKVSGWLDGSIAAPERAAPAAGLFLEAVRYPKEPWRLPPLMPLCIPWQVFTGSFPNR